MTVRMERQSPGMHTGMQDHPTLPRYLCPVNSTMSSHGWQYALHSMHRKVHVRKAPSLGGFMLCGKNDVGAGANKQREVESCSAETENNPHNTNYAKHFKRKTMAPNPIVIPKRKPVPEPKSRQAGGTAAGFSGLTWSLASTSLVVLLVATLPWARRWLYSAAAIESLLLIHGSAADTRILHKIPLWTLLASLNVVYAVASTSWLLYGFFAAGCYPLALFTCLCQFSVVSNFSRRRLRTLLRELHFTQDKIAFFDLPALEIDVDVNGLFVVRGLTISLSSLTIEAHGVELGK